MTYQYKSTEKIMIIDIISSDKSTEGRIFNAAFSTFLLYGYHGTTMQKIAQNAKVNKASIHYYFRSKKKLYKKVVCNIYNYIQEHNATTNLKHKIHTNIRWFLYTEMYNNNKLFKQTLIELYGKHWKRKINEAKHLS